MFEEYEPVIPSALANLEPSLLAVINCLGYMSNNWVCHMHTYWTWSSTTDD
jgi:hypothetical protein